MGNHDAFLLDEDVLYTYTSMPMVIESRWIGVCGS
jgi:hypothetical protein